MGGDCGRGLCGVVGRIGCVVAAGTGICSGGSPRGAAGQGRDTRGLPRDQRAGGRTVRPPGMRHCRPAVHLHMGPAGDRASQGTLRREAIPGASILPGARVVAHRAPRRPGLELRGARRVRAVLPAPVLVAAAATEALSGLPGRRPGRGARSAEDYAMYLVRLARARRNNFVLAGVGGQRPALEPLPEGRHARPRP